MTKRRSTPRRAAEWLTLSLSALLILAVVVFLVREATQGAEPYVTVELSVLRQDARSGIVPVEVFNPGEVALMDVVVRIEAGEGRGHEVTLDYLGEQERQKIYVYARQAGEVRAEVLSYRVE